MDLRYAKCGLFISLQQLKMKVAKLTQTKDTHSEMEYWATINDINSSKDI
jgi:hypothetical protein